MKQSYPTKTVNPSTYNGQPLAIPLAYFKQLADVNAVQMDITLKPEGIRVNLVKKFPDKTVKKRKIECENNELNSFHFRFQQALQDILAIAPQVGIMGGYI